MFWLVDEMLQREAPENNSITCDKEAKIPRPIVTIPLPRRGMRQSVVLESISRFVEL